MEFRKILVRFAGAAAAIAFGSTLLVGTATSAQAAPAVYYQVINGNSSNSCLQVSGTGSQRNVVLGNCDRSAKQVWTIENGYWRNPASGHCLDGNGADVYTMVCNYGDFQHYTTSSGSPKSIRHTWSGKFLHGSGVVGSEVVYRLTIGTASRWVIDQV